MERRFIEENFPLKKISEESAREKSIRHGHISLLHIWWARRPLTASRATIFSSFIPVPQTEKVLQSQLGLIENLSKWENSLNNEIMNDAKKKIHEFFNGIQPKLLDPFAGGGSIPLEAMRLGCETYACDYNPVAILILKCVLEFPQKFSGVIMKNGLQLNSTNMLIDDIKKWSTWVFEESKKDIERIYADKDDKIIGYIWVRTISCPNPSCGAEIPLMRNFWLAHRSKKKIFLSPKIKKNKIDFEIIEISTDRKDVKFDPDQGTINRSVATCLVCSTNTDANTIRKTFLNHKSGERLVAIIFQKTGSREKNYRLPSFDDVQRYEESKIILEKKKKELFKNWNIEPIPTEEIPLMSGTFNVPLYGYHTWGDLFNPRQSLANITFIEKLHESRSRMIVEGYDEEYAKAISTYLAFILDKQLDYNSTLSTWVSKGEFIRNTFGRQALPMIWDHFELNPFSGSSGNWNSATKWIIDVINHLSYSGNALSMVKQSSATSIDFEDEFFDAVITDPPYYNSVPYADLSDFFYVWLKRSIGYLYPELFSTPLTPKTEELVEMSSWDKIRYAHKTKDFFEKNMNLALKEMYRVLKPNGICVLVYAHKSTEGWESLINSFLQSGLVITAAWPINTERPGRLRINESAALASSIYMIARKLKKEPIGFYREIKSELKKYLNKKLDHLWNQNVGGADFFISAIGSAIEVFGKYDKIIDDSDNIIQVSKLLNDTREIVTNYAIQKVLHSEFSDQISKMTRFYILWRWAYGEASVPFNDALKMAQSVGIDIEHEWNKGFIIKEKENIRVLGPDKREIEDLEKSHELIDVLHYALILWKKNKKEELDKLLREKGFSKSDMFKRVAQAISESLPAESTEKKRLDGFLTGFRVDNSQSGAQTKLYD